MKSTIDINLEQATAKLESIVENSLSSIKSITFGDLHGNTYKLLCFLSAVGIIPQQNLMPLAKIFNKIQPSWDWLDKQQAELSEIITSFTEQLNRTPFSRVNFKLRFIGDTLADRVGCDWLTLLVFAKLDEAKIDFSILYSNHDQEFLLFYEATLRGKRYCSSMPNGHIYSLVALVAYLFNDSPFKDFMTSYQDKKTNKSKFRLNFKARFSGEKRATFLSLVRCYRQHLMLAETEQSKGKHYIFTHAPTSATYLRLLRNKLGYCFMFNWSAKSGIKALNEAFRDQAGAQRLTPFIRAKEDEGRYKTEIVDHENKPTWAMSGMGLLATFPWTRASMKETSETWINVFGHVGGDFKERECHEINLDGQGNELGKDFLQNCVEGDQIKQDDRAYVINQVPIFVTYR